MASWTLLEAASGYIYDATSAHMTLTPRFNSDQFRSFFITAGGWGSFHREGQRAEVNLDYGSLQLEQLDLPGDTTAVTISLADKPLATTIEQAADRIRIRFSQPLFMVAGEQLTIQPS
jgi:hypothetical protein